MFNYLNSNAIGLLVFVTYLEIRTIRVIRNYLLDDDVIKGEATARRRGIGGAD
jgi:hypothetical protein